MTRLIPSDYNFVCSMVILWMVLLVCCSSVTHALSSSSLDPFLPTSSTAVARQAASSIATAYFEHGIYLQTIRLPLSESMYRTKEEGFVADRAIGWQGGPQETIQYLTPLVKSMLHEISTSKLHPSTVGGLVIKIKEQILLDFDGSLVLSVEHPAGPKYDIQALLQPNTDNYYRKIIKSIELQLSGGDLPNNDKVKRLFLIINPGWKNKDSWSFWESNQVENEIINRYETTYSVDQFVVRGIQISLVKEFHQDYAVYETIMPYEQQKQQQRKMTNDDDPNNNNNVRSNEPISSSPSPRLIGTFPERPDYQELDSLVLSSRQQRNK